MINVGFRYTCKQFPDLEFDIIFKSLTQTKLPYLGISNQGSVVMFDSHGRDEWIECGGCWYELDLATERPALRHLTRVLNRQVEQMEENVCQEEAKTE